MNFDVVIVGGGVAGLTAAAYLSRAGLSVLLCEKEKICGGLVNTFERDGFVYDGGIRAIENSGVTLPMAKQLGLEIDWMENPVTMGIENQFINIDSQKSVQDYQNLLSDLYPESKDEIHLIIENIKKIMHYMDVQYGIDNPVFLDFKQDKEYMLKSVLPWMLKYALTSPKISALNEPVEAYLQRLTQNQSLLDIIVQHFFRETPAFFALSYLKLFMDYHYPRGGTGKFVESLTTLISQQGGLIRTETQIIKVDLEKKAVFDTEGEQYDYKSLIWAADLKTLYQNIETSTIKNRDIEQAVLQRRELLENKTGNDSVLTVYLALDLDKQYFAAKNSAHFFYTPVRTGLSAVGAFPFYQEKTAQVQWLKDFFALTTYEISIPVLRDETLAPAGKTGLIISTLFDYKITKQIENEGWYQEFTDLAEASILKALSASIYPEINQKIIHQFSSTPLSIAKRVGTTEGAITGWAFTNDPVPAESRIPKIYNAVRTPLPSIFQAGQWTYSPSGFPIALLTGKIAADQAAKDLSKRS